MTITTKEMTKDQAIELSLHRGTVSYPKTEHNIKIMKARVDDILTKLHADRRNEKNK